MNSDLFYFWICWGLLGLGSFLFFKFNKNAGLKRFIFPFFTLFMSALFIYMMVAIMHFNSTILMIAIPVSLLISFLNYRKTRFCDNCGETVIGGSQFVPPIECNKCKSQLR